MDQSFSWRFFEHFIVAFLQFAVMLVFVRFVAPDQMGIAIICLAIFHLVNSVFVIRLSNVLIQKDEVDELDFSTTLLSQLVLATLFYLILYGSSGVVASWFQLDVIGTALRIVGVTVFFYAVSSLYTAHIIRSIKYSSLFFINSMSALIAAIICIFLVLFQYGLFSVLLWTFFYQLFSVLLMVLFYEWRPRMQFSLRRLTSLVNEGRKQIGVMSGVNALFKNGQQVAVGYFFNPAALSFYVRGERIPAGLLQQFAHVFHEKLLPLFLKGKDDAKKLHLKIRELVVLSGFVILPFMTLIFVTADQLILLLFGERWLFAVPFMQIFCVYYTFLSISSVFSQAMTALDLTGPYIKINVLKKGILLLLWLISFPLGIKAVALSMIVFSIISLFLNRFFLKPYINYGTVQMFKDLAPVFVLSTTMGVLIYLLHYLLPSSLLFIVFQFVLGALFYGSLAYFFKLQGWKLLGSTLYAFYTRYAKRRLSSEKSPTL